MIAPNDNVAWELAEDGWASGGTPEPLVEAPPRSGVAALAGVAGVLTVALALAAARGGHVAATAGLVTMGASAAGFALTALLLHRVQSDWRRSLLEREGLVEEIGQELEARDAAIAGVRRRLEATRRRVRRLEEAGEGASLSDIQADLDALEANVRRLADETGQEPLLRHRQN